MELRSFVAVELPERTVRALTVFHRAFTQASPAWAGEKWVREQNLHLTLKFMAALPEELLPAVEDALTSACARIAPFEMTLSGPRAVPSDRRAKMLWASFDVGREQCAELAEAVDGALVLLGLPAESRSFRTHVTLVRTRRDRRASRTAIEEAWAAAFGRASSPAASMSVGSVTLFSSRLGQGGPTYQRLGTYPLGAD